MTDRAISFFLRAYLALIFIFVFAPITANVVFSFNSLRFPTVPLGSFSLEWYQMVVGDSNIWQAAQRSVLIAAVAAVSGLLFGFDTAVINGALIFLREELDLTTKGTEIAATSLLLGCAVGAFSYMEDSTGLEPAHTFLRGTRAATRTPSPSNMAVPPKLADLTGLEPAHPR